MADQGRAANDENRETALEALRQIAADRMPCEDCGEVHEKRTVGQMTTWAHPKDNHSYRQPKPWVYARRVVVAIEKENADG